MPATDAPVIDPPAAPPATPPATDPKPEDKKIQEKLFTQAELDAHIESRLAREQEKSKKDAEKAALKATEEAAAKNGEWETLAKARETSLTESAARIAELEPHKEKAERYKTALDGYVNGLTAALPEPIKALLAGKDPVEQLEYLTKYGASLGVKSGPPSTPPESPETVTDAELARRRAESEARYRNQ